jgi:hypothetical protein
VDILKWLDTSFIVQAYEVLDFRVFKSGWYYKIRVELTDGSVLHAREYADEKERNYAYHWQDEQYNLRVRWDNAPHHPHLITHPHHRHEGTQIVSSKEITLQDVLKAIEKRLMEK